MKRLTSVFRSLRTRTRGIVSFGFTSAWGIAILTLPAVLGGCTGFKAATKQNFTNALNVNYALQDECLYPSALRFPYEVSTKESSNPMAKGLDALTGAGLLQRTEEKDIHVKRYSLTTFGSRINSRFCYGHRVVISIEHFALPRQVNGQTMSRVDFQYKMMDVPGWAQSDSMKRAFPALAQALGPKPTAEATLELTQNGWRVLD